jgi:exonuclease VII small subunit
VRVAEVRATAEERATWLRTQLQQAAADLEQAVEADAAAQQRARLAEAALGAAQERVEGARARADLS